MAIDTRNKRASAIALRLPFGRVRPMPDGSLASAPDRRQLGASYAGDFLVIEVPPVIHLRGTNGYRVRLRGTNGFRLRLRGTN